MWIKTESHDAEPAQPLRLIWIDALCINQDDTGEKLAQISSMNQVYRRDRMGWI